MPPSLLDLLKEPGLSEYPEYLRPYLAPLTRSIAPNQGTMMPARSGGVDRSEETLGNKGPTLWSPFGFMVAEEPVLSSGPQAGQHTRPAQSPSAYRQNWSLWNLLGVATGWSRPLSPTPGRQPTTKLAIGRWTPIGGAARPLPTNPTPGQMVRPLT